MLNGKATESNMVRMTGEIVSEPCLVREGRGEKLYMAYILTRRTSGVTDRIPLIIPGRLIGPGDCIGHMVSVEGQFRSYNRNEEGKSKLILSVFVKEIILLETGWPVDFACNNRVFLDGFICKAPIYRKTPKGREIADVILAVNRPHGKSDYIPCIAWGRNARFASGFEVGSRVKVWGRVQSREYTKKLSETECEKRIAYEVSVSKLECLED